MKGDDSGASDGMMNATGGGAATSSAGGWGMPTAAATPEATSGASRDPMGEIAGAQQGHEGMAQGHTGAMYGAMTGPYDGMQRAASGGMTPSPYSDILAKIIPALGSMLSEHSGIGQQPK